MREKKSSCEICAALVCFTWRYVVSENHSDTESVYLGPGAIREESFAEMEALLDPRAATPLFKQAYGSSINAEPAVVNRF